ncbi:sulfatase-like hydrolase/transferase [Desulfobacula sp.]|uniref:sulfatase-like hydrolase/transferase n=1 Tax=Desulfobacula sp. TaxID=2593537 RepID=UPI00261A870A|nr:sulfatase-like hydrolase/transferase [Desulfobacula sp.]
MKNKSNFARKACKWAAVGCVLAGVTLAVAATPQDAAAASKKAEKPNVVLMLSDNVGYGDIGAFQGGAIRGAATPNIDSIGAKGMTFTQFLVEPGCTPSRAGLLTGRYSPRCGLGTIIIGGTPNTLQAEEITMAEIFKSVGYATGYVGKWHLGSEEQSWPVRQGFDEYRVGVIETSDSTLYRPQMERLGFSEETIQKKAPGIWDGTTKDGLKRVREYDVEYKHIVEDDIAKASVKIINTHAATKEPFFLLVGLTQTHYPNVTSPEFSGKSENGPYADALLQHDHAVGEILDAIQKSGIEDNTIVIYISDNGATPLGGPAEFRGGSNGMYSGELGDGREGSIRTPGMIKWPGKIPVGKNNGMFAIHDFFPTFANIIGAEVPKDRPIDGIDQTDFLLGKQDNSNREAFLTFIGDEIVAVRWRQFRLYPNQFVSGPGNPSMPGTGGGRIEGNSLPATFNIEQDPREENNMLALGGWIFPHYMKAIGEYKKTLEKYPNPGSASLNP